MIFIFNQIIISSILFITPLFSQSSFWFKTNGPKSKAITSIVFDSHNHLFAATHGTGVYKTSDNGNTWMNLGLEGFDLYQIISHNNGYLFVTSTQGIFKSTDDGMHWIESNNGIKNRNNVGRIVNNKTGILFVSSSLGLSCELYRSSDNGENWINVTSKDISMLYNIHSILTNSLSYIFVAGSMGIVRSTDDGITWTKSWWEEYVGNLAVNSKDNIFACVGALSSGLRISIDHGNTWSVFGLLNYWIWVIITKQDKYIYTSAQYGYDNKMSFKYTNNNGQSWITDNSGLESMHITAFAISKDDYLFAGTDSGYIFRTTGKLTSTEENKNTNAKEIRLYYNYPNPFSKETIIYYHNEDVSFNNIIIYNTLGKVVRHIFNGMQWSGNYEYVWNGTDDDGNISPRGIYFCEITTNNIRSFKRFSFIICHIKDFNP